MSSRTPELPAHYPLPRGQFVFSLLSLVVALIALGALGVRLVIRLDLVQWWVPVMFVIGMAAADFASGLIHWAADTWGRDDCPVIGHRLLVPFRIHHLNPDDLLRRSFIDANGDPAFLTVPVLLGLFAVQIETIWGGAVLVFGFALCGVGMMTNQIHKWAHMPCPPKPVRALQNCGVLLGPTAHAAHHDRPYDANYCITTGWCNRPAEAIGLYRCLEATITFVTGAHPRDDDRRQMSRYRHTSNLSTVRHE
jgi:ubiquitin-conjugating enzyme E2 variant